MEIQFLRDTTYIFLEQSIILKTIEDLLWQAGQRNSSSKPPQHRKARPTVSTS
jgi:hypothetical protein